MINIPLLAAKSQQAQLNQISKKWNFDVRPLNQDDVYFLEIKNDRLPLNKQDEPRLKGICVDFVSGAVEYRRKFGGGRKQAIAKAVGLKKGANPTVVDATAGMGRDAFVLASLGCRVQMIERLAVVAALLEDGLRRAKENAEIGSWVSQRLTLSFQNSHNALQSLKFTPDVIYLDPMYPEKKKSALVKKEMRIFKSLIGSDEDADGLLEAALKTAADRVVVKRPDYGEFLAGKLPDISIKTKNNRFDIYLVK